MKHGEGVYEYVLKFSGEPSFYPYLAFPSRLFPLERVLSIDCSPRHRVTSHSNDTEIRIRIAIIDHFRTHTFNCRALKPASLGCSSLNRTCNIELQLQTPGPLPRISQQDTHIQNGKRVCWPHLESQPLSLSDEVASSTPSPSSTRTCVYSKNPLTPIQLESYHRPHRRGGRLFSSMVLQPKGREFDVSLSLHVDPELAKQPLITQQQCLAQHTNPFIHLMLPDVGYVLSPFPALCLPSKRKLTYLLAIVFMAQWHPLIAPKRGNMRPERVPE